MTRSLPLLISMALLVACQGDPKPAQPEHEAPQVSAGLDRPLSLVERRDPSRALDYVFRPDEPMRHAYRDPSLRPQAKADGDEVRVAYPQHYAITTPPAAAVRPMVEWEPMQAVVMQVPDYIANYGGVMETIGGISAAAIEVAEVWFVVESGAMQSELKSTITSAGVSSSVVAAKTRFLTTNLESIWFIDSGPRLRLQAR